MNKEMPLVDDIIANKDMIDGFRNKVENSVGRRYAPAKEGQVTDDGQKMLYDPQAEVCVGYNRGLLQKGLQFVEPPDNVRANSKESVIVAK